MTRFLRYGVEKLRDGALTARVCAICFSLCYYANKNRNQKELKTRSKAPALRGLCPLAPMLRIGLTLAFGQLESVGASALIFKS